MTRTHTARHDRARHDRARHDRVTTATRSTPTVHRAGAWAFVVGAAGTTIAGVLIQTLVIPTTDVDGDRWSYPWETGAFVAVSFVYIVLHLLVAAGLVEFGRSGVAGTSRAARRGVVIAVAGTLTLTVGEIIGLPIRDALTNDTSARVVGAVFGIGVLLSAVGFLVLGVSTLRARVWCDWRGYTPLATGIWTSILVVLPLAVPTALPGCVAIYGACLLAMALGLYQETRTIDDRAVPPVG